MKVQINLHLTSERQLIWRLYLKNLILFRHLVCQLSPPSHLTCLVACCIECRAVWNKIEIQTQHQTNAAENDFYEIIDWDSIWTAMAEARVCVLTKSGMHCHCHECPDMSRTIRDMVSATASVRTARPPCVWWWWSAMSWLAWPSPELLSAEPKIPWLGCTRLVLTPRW